MYFYIRTDCYTDTEAGKRGWGKETKTIQNGDYSSTTKSRCIKLCGSFHGGGTNHYFSYLFFVFLNRLIKIQSFKRTFKVVCRIKDLGGKWSITERAGRWSRAGGGGEAVGSKVSPLCPKSSNLFVLFYFKWHTATSGGYFSLFHDTLEQSTWSTTAHTGRGQKQKYLCVFPRSQRKMALCVVVLLLLRRAPVERAKVTDELCVCVCWEGEGSSIVWQCSWWLHDETLAVKRAGRSEERRLDGTSLSLQRRRPASTARRPFLQNPVTHK